MLWRGCMILKNVQSLNQITTLTYVLIDNFCPCFYKYLKKEDSFKDLKVYKTQAFYLTFVSHFEIYQNVFN